MLNLLFLQTGASWLYKKNILNSDELLTYADSKLVVIEFDRNKDVRQMMELMKKYKIRSWPSSILLDSEGKELVRNIGSLSPAKLIESYKKYEVKKEVEKEDKKEKAKPVKKVSALEMKKLDNGLWVPTTAEENKRVQRLAKLGYRLEDYNRMGVSFPPSEENAKLMEFFIKKYPRPVRDHKKSEVRGMFRFHKTKK
jgi:hypothetical protein